MNALIKVKTLIYEKYLGTDNKIVLTSHLEGISTLTIFFKRNGQNTEFNHQNLELETPKKYEKGQK